MDVNERLRKMLEERGLTTYKMAELSGLSHTTLANVFKRNNWIKRAFNGILSTILMGGDDFGSVYSLQR